MYEGEPGDRVMILLAGRVKVTCLTDNGCETLVGVSDPGDFLGELSYVGCDARLATVVALEPVEVLTIPSTAFRAYVGRRPLVALALIELLAQRLRATTTRLARFSRSDTMGRLAALLTELIDRYGRECERGVEISLTLSQDELSAWTGASRAGVTKALQTLRELGWIETGRRRIVVRNLEALRARAA